MLRKGGQNEVDGGSPGGPDFDPFQSRGSNMGGTGRKNNPPDNDAKAPVKPPPAPGEDDDTEDGDIATPKRDRSGEDDEPL